MIKITLCKYSRAKITVKYHLCLVFSLLRFEIKVDGTLKNIYTRGMTLKCT